MITMFGLSHIWLKALNCQVKLYQLLTTFSYSLAPFIAAFALAPNYSQRTSTHWRPSLCGACRSFLLWCAATRTDHSCFEMAGTPTAFTTPNQLGSMPATAISGIRFRQSQQGGRAWAKPEMLPSQIRSLKARADFQPISPTEALRSTLRILELCTGRWEELLQKVVFLMGASTHTPFNLSNNATGIKACDYRPMRNFLGHWDGAVEFERKPSGVTDNLR